MTKRATYKKSNIHQLLAVCAVGTNPAVSNILNYVTCMLSKGIVPILMTLAVAVFIYGVVTYAINVSDQKKREEGRNLIIWGLIALTVIVSILGFVGIIKHTFKLNNVGPTVQNVS